MKQILTFKALLPFASVILVLFMPSIGKSQRFKSSCFVDPDIIVPSDPSTFIACEYDSEVERMVPFSVHTDSRRIASMHLIRASFANDINIEFLVNATDFSRRRSLEKAEDYAKILGQIPRPLLSSVGEVIIHDSWESFAALSADRQLLIPTRRADSDRKEGVLEELLFHELAHLTDFENGFRNQPQWAVAKEEDGQKITQYADRNNAEDFAETFLMYFAATYQPERISPATKQHIEQTIPNRLAFMDGLNLDMSPYSRGSDEVIHLERVTPTIRSTFRSSVITFSWNKHPGTDYQYTLKVGTVLGGDDLFDESSNEADHFTVSDLPTNGGDVFVRLITKTRVGNNWVALGSRDYQYLAASGNNAQLATLIITNPCSGATLMADQLKLSWTKPENVDNVSISYGYSGFSGDYETEHTNVDEENPLIIRNIDPGKELFVKITSRIDGTNFYAQYTFRPTPEFAAGTSSLKDINPSTKLRLQSNSIFFSMNNPFGVWNRVEVGTDGPGSNDILDRVLLSDTSFHVNDIPNNSEHALIYVRLTGHIVFNNERERISHDYAFFAPRSDDQDFAEISNVESVWEEMFSSQNVEFEFTNPEGTSRWDLKAGTTEGGRDIRNWRQTRNPRIRMAGIDNPEDHRVIYVTINSKVNGTWRRKYYTFTN